MPISLGVRGRGTARRSRLPRRVAALKYQGESPQFGKVSTPRMEWPVSTWENSPLSTSGDEGIHNQTRPGAHDLGYKPDGSCGTGKSDRPKVEVAGSRSYRRGEFPNPNFQGFGYTRNVYHAAPEVAREQIPNPSLVLLPRPLPYFDVQPLDLLIQGGKRDVELLGRIGLVPVAALQFLNDDAPLDVFENVEQRSIGIVLEQRVLEAASGDVARQQIRPDDGA